MAKKIVLTRNSPSKTEVEPMPGKCWETEFTQFVRCFHGLGGQSRLGITRELSPNLKGGQKLFGEDGALEVSKYYQEYLQPSVVDSNILEKLLSRVPYF